LKINLIQYLFQVNSVNGHLFNVIEYYLIQEKCEKKDNNNINLAPFIVEKTNIVNIGKRGRKKKKIISNKN